MSVIWKWVTDPKNRGVINLIAITILIMVILMQCSHSRGLQSDLDKQKTEMNRVTNNDEAKNAPIVQGKLNDTTWKAERLAIKITMKELKQSNADLLQGFEDFKKHNPKTIEKVTFHETERIVQVPVYVKLDSLGRSEFVFNDTAKFADGNYRKLSGILPYSTLLFNKKDSTQVNINALGLYSKIKPERANFTIEQGIKLKVGLFEDPKTGKVKIAATTSYPGISFTQLEGSDIMSDEVSKKAARQFRKTWALGVHLGYGAGVDLKTNQVFFGPQLGIGLSYNPKWLQWGK